MGLYNNVSTKVRNVRLSTIKEDCSFTETDDNPDENGKKQQEILPMKERAYAVVFIQAMQKAEDERASCKHCSGNFFYHRR